jgi:acetyltransferase EpsM
METKEKIWIYGASGHGKVVLDCLMANQILLKGFIDDDLSKKQFVNYKVLSFEVIESINDLVVFGIGDNKIRKKLVDKYNFRYLTVQHPTSTLSPTSVIGEGSVMFHHSIIQTGCSIGRHCIINTSASIDHDCNIEDFVHISPNATLCGGVTIGVGTHFGAAAVVIPNIKIGKWATIGAGAVVIRDVPDYAVVVGNPAKIIRYNEKE